MTFKRSGVQDGKTGCTEVVRVINQFDVGLFSFFSRELCVLGFHTHTHTLGRRERLGDRTGSITEGCVRAPCSGDRCRLLMALD